MVSVWGELTHYWWWRVVALMAHSEALGIVTALPARTHPTKYCCFQAPNAAIVKHNMLLFFKRNMRLLCQAQCISPAAPIDQSHTIISYIRYTQAPSGVLSILWSGLWPVQCGGWATNARGGGGQGNGPLPGPRATGF